MNNFFSFFTRVLGFRRQPRVLFIDDFFPDPRRGAGAPRARAILLALRQAGALVTVLPTLIDLRPDDLSIQGCVVATGYGGSGIDRYLKEHLDDVDIIFISRPHNIVEFRLSLDFPAGTDSIPIIYDAEAVFAEREIMHRELLGEILRPEEAESAIQAELGLAKGTRMVLAVSERIAGMYRKAGYIDVRVVPYSVIPQFTNVSFDQRDGFLFVGPCYSDNTPNSDSVVWFIDRVLPIVREIVSREICFTLAGRNSSPLVLSRSSDSVISLGESLDLAPIYSAARVFVAPTRFAAGIPLKVIDAAANGVPTVLTPLLATQLNWTHEKETLVASSPREFAEQCARLHEERNLWHDIQQRAIERVAREYNRQTFDQIIETVLRDAKGNPYSENALV